MNRPFGATLTPRDLEVLRLAATGSTHAQTAAHLGIGESSVKNRSSDILEKLDAQSVLHAVALMDDYRPGWAAASRISCPPGDRRTWLRP